MGTVDLEMGNSQPRVMPVLNLPNFMFPAAGPPIEHALENADAQLKTAWTESPSPNCLGMFPFYCMFFGGGVDTSLFGDKVRRMAAQGLVARTVVNSGVSNVGILCGAKILQHDELLFEREFMGGELQCHIVSFSVRYHVQAHGMDGAVSITHDAEDVVAMSTSLNQLAAEGWMLRVVYESSARSGGGCCTDIYTTEYLCTMV